MHLADGYRATGRQPGCHERVVCHESMDCCAGAAVKVCRPRAGVRTFDYGAAKTIEEPRVNKKRLAEAVRTACLKAAREGYASAALSGLCHEGAVEVSLDAIHSLDLEAVLRAAVPTPDEKP